MVLGAACYNRRVFTRTAALRPIPEFARVRSAVVESVEKGLDDSDALQQVLDMAYSQLEGEHGALADWLSDTLAEVQSELAQSVGYFLCVAVFMVFREGFPRNLQTVDQTSVELALATLQADEELRQSDPMEVLQSDDLLALGQPVVMDFIQHHVREALEQGGDDPPTEDMEWVYRALLVEVITLSHAVTPPEGATQALS